LLYLNEIKSSNNKIFDNYSIIAYDGLKVSTLFRKGGQFLLRYTVPERFITSDNLEQLIQTALIIPSEKN